MTLTVKDFANTLKIKDDTLLERMKLAGLSHSKPSDKITPEDKLAILKSLKARKNTSSKSVTPSLSSDGVIVKSKGALSKPSKAATKATEGLSDNIEAKRQAAAENLKEQQQKREDQIKEAIEKTDHHLDSKPDAKKQVAGLVEKMISEYNSYIKFAIEINPYELKVIKTLRNSKQFWIDWREENLE